MQLQKSLLILEKETYNESIVLNCNKFSNEKTLKKNARKRASGRDKTVGESES